jgi:hypothetical protein
MQASKQAGRQRWYDEANSQAGRLVVAGLMQALAAAYQVQPGQVCHARQTSRQAGRQAGGWLPASCRP